MINIDKFVMKKIIGIIPEIKNEKPITKVITKDLSVFIIDKNIRIVLKSLAKYFEIDLKLTKLYSKTLTKVSNSLVLPFDKDNIFIPFNLRKVTNSNDIASGYFNIDYIKDIYKLNGQAVLILKGDMEIKLKQNMKTAIKHMKEGEIVKRHYKSYPIRVYSGEDYKGFERMKFDIASKDDIYMLTNEILVINKLINSF
ncbi:MAG: hypothetical protein FH753_03055 [Firmicutes bacterium]|nr:hypothetical protein [Bacillota bacterium]